MVVMLEEDKTAEKKATNAAGASSNEAQVSVEATKSATTSTSRRLKLETRQVLDDAIYQCASRVPNVRKNLKQFRNTYLMSKSDSKNHIEEKFYFP